MDEKTKINRSQLKSCSHKQVVHSYLIQCLGRHSPAGSGLAITQLLCTYQKTVPSSQPNVLMQCATYTNVHDIPAQEDGVIWEPEGDHHFSEWVEEQVIQEQTDFPYGAFGD